MSTDLAISPEHRGARNQATLAFADLGPNPSRIELYDAADVLLVAVVLARPPGQLVGPLAVLQQADPAGDLILTSGVVARGVWLNGQGDVVGEGAVTAQDGPGPFRLAGTAEGSTALYAGGRCQLGLTAVG